MVGTAGAVAGAGKVREARARAAAPVPAGAVLLVVAHFGELVGEAAFADEAEVSDYQCRLPSADRSQVSE